MMMMMMMMMNITVVLRQYMWCCYHGTAFAKVHVVHLMNVEHRQAATDP